MLIEDRDVARALEAMHREAGNAEPLAALLRDRAATETDPAARSAALLELGDFTDDRTGKKYGAVNTWSPARALVIDGLTGDQRFFLSFAQDAAIAAQAPVPSAERARPVVQATRTTAPIRIDG